MTAEPCTLVDCHVHFHPQFDAVRVLDAAADNLQTAATSLGAGTDWAGVLLLTEMSGVDWFGAARERILQGGLEIGKWTLSLSAEPQTLLATAGGGGRKLRLLAGRQIETVERIEVLALMTCETVADGMALDATLNACHATGALVVLPWGVGKWIGRRGELVAEALGKRDDAPPVLAGDNGGRPWFWPRPAVFARLEAQNLPVLAGTDPLPLANQAARVGSFGMAFTGNIDDANAAGELKARFLSMGSSRNMRAFGRLERAPRFMINQLRLRA